MGFKFQNSDFQKRRGSEPPAKRQKQLPAEEPEAAVAVCKEQEAVESVKEQADVEEAVQEEQTTASVAPATVSLSAINVIPIL